MHFDLEKFSRAVARVAAAVGVSSENGKLLLGIEGFLTLLVAACVALFMVHDVVLLFLGRQSSEALVAFVIGAGVVLLSIALVVIREKIIQIKD